MSEAYYDCSAHWALIPDHMRGVVERYVMEGVPPGSFLTAVLSNDLKGAFGRADMDNARAMMGWVQFICNYVPGTCQGSPERVAAWIDRGGMNRRAAA